MNAAEILPLFSNIFSSYTESVFGEFGKCIYLTLSFIVTR